MKYINQLKEGDRVGEVYFVKQKTSAMTKNGKPYENLILQDKTGTIDAKIWDVNSGGIGDFDTMDYVYVVGDVVTFMNAPQMNIRRARKVQEGEYDPADYLPMSEQDIPSMYQMLLGFVEQIRNPYLKKLAESFFGDADFAKRFQFHSAAKSVHHGFVGGLLEHTLHVTQMCDFYAALYPVINHDLLITAAMFHDIGKLSELSRFPENDYTDDGQLLGHIMIGAMEVQRHIDAIEGFPKKLGSELIHCILAHHGELEYGSPKKPALIEAIALSFADNTDAKLETMREALNSIPDGNMDWQGYNRFLETNIRRTSDK